MTDQGLVGREGRVITAIGGSAKPGEIRVVVDGLPQYLIAYAEEPIEVDGPVLVIDSRGAGQFDVVPWPATLRQQQ